MLILLFLPLSALPQAGQCVSGGCTNNVLYGTAIGGTSLNYFNRTAGMELATGNNFLSFTVLAGQTYEWSFCPVDGAILPYAPEDVNATLLDANNTVLCHSNDVCGAFPKIRWAATATGNVKLVLRMPGCTASSTGPTYKPVWRCVSCGPPSPYILPCTVAPRVLCGTDYTAAFDAAAGTYSMSSCGTANGRERIFWFRAGSSGASTIQQTGSHTAIKWYLKSGDMGCDSTGWTCIGTLNGAATSPSFPVVAEQRYLLMAEPSTIVGGNVSFTLDCIPEPHPCASPQVVACNTVYNVTVPAGWGLLNEANGACTAAVIGEERVLRFSPPANGTYSIVQLSSSAVCSWFTNGSQDDPCNLTNCIGSGSGAQDHSIQMLAHRDYYLRLENSSTTAALDVSFRIDCSQVESPCGSITPLTCGVATTVDLDGNGVWHYPQGGCGFPTIGAERIFSFTPVNTGIYTFHHQTGPSFNDINYFVKPASDGCSTTGWTCVGRMIGNNGYTNGIDLIGGQAYYLLLDAGLPDPATVTFSVGCTATGPCATEVQLTDCGPFISASTPSFSGVWNQQAESCGGTALGTERVYRFTALSGGSRFLEFDMLPGAVRCWVKPASGGCQRTGWTCIGTYASGASDRFPVTAGESYFVLIDPVFTTGGTLRLRLACASPITPCDMGVLPIACGVNVNAVIPADGGYHHQINTTCGGSSPGWQQVYSFVALTTGAHSISQSNATQGMHYYYRPASVQPCGSASGWTCAGSFAANTAGQTPMMNMTAGVNYHIMLAATSTSGGSAIFRVECGYPDACGQVENMVCDEPKWVVLPAGTGGEPFNQCSGGGSLTNMNGYERIFRFTAVTTGSHAIMQLDGSGTFQYSYLDEQVIIDQIGDCEDANTYNCIGNITGSGGLPVHFTAGTTYFILIDKQGTNTASLRFAVYCPTASNVTCATAHPLTISPYWECNSIVSSNAGLNAQDGPDPLCDVNGPWPDVWFSFNSGPSGNAMVDVSFITATDIVLDLFTVGSGMCIGAPVWCQVMNQTTSAILPVSPSTNYLLRVSSNMAFGDPGSFGICLHERPVPTCTQLVAPLSGSQFAGGSDVTLNWRTIPGATSYDLYYGQNFPLTLLEEGLADTVYTLSSPPAGDYSWRILPRNITGPAINNCIHWTFTVEPQPTIGALVSVEVFLDGAYVPGDGLMRDALRSAGVIPGSDPYDEAPFMHTGSEQLVEGALLRGDQDAIVDWVLLELRKATAPSEVVASRAALLQRDGDVVDTDGESAVYFLVDGQEPFHVAVRHRNHMGIMTADPVVLDTLSGTLDFTSPAFATYGTAARKQLFGSEGPMVLWSGDVSNDGLLQYTGAGNDRDRLLFAIGGSVPTNTVGGYRKEDLNLDAVTKYTGTDNDRDLILFNIGGSVPTAVRHQQLP
jgi:hypothetical protein